ncbi:hypothetical protein PROFUN_03645 [Planoprotostelium fungivorum]|uniref:Uncharacterized protein n=1 Tax=Planoprotostelium fungivorum TaxID=1890364 RepID=A0A2P6NSF8_9EUKA|nr:hypothetical protein PROFUN_03645 [Planoprotostelium fungivorum]
MTASDIHRLDIARAHAHTPKKSRGVNPGLILGMSRQVTDNASSWRQVQRFALDSQQSLEGGRDYGYYTITFPNKCSSQTDELEM